MNLTCFRRPAPSSAVCIPSTSQNQQSRLCRDRQTFGGDGKILDGRRALIFNGDAGFLGVRAAIGHERSRFWRRTRKGVPCCSAQYEDYEPVDDRSLHHPSHTELFASTQQLTELLKEVLTLVEELNEPLDGALVADIIAAPALSSSKKAVELCIEVFTSEELLDTEKRINIRDSVVKHMASDVEMVMIVQRFRISSVSTLADPFNGLTAFVSGNVARYDHKMKFRSRMKKLEADGLLRRPTWHPEESSLGSNQKLSRFGSQRTDEAYGVTLIHPSGAQKFLLARPREPQLSRDRVRKRKAGAKSRDGDLDVQHAVFDSYVRDTLELLA